MRKLVGLMVTLAILWCGWWYVASTGGERAALDWLEQRRAEGWQAEVAEIERTGFPFALRYDITGVRISDPVNSLGIAIDEARLSASAWWPGDVTLTLPETPVEITTLEGPFTVQTTQGSAEINLHPGTSLQLEAVRAVSAEWRINGPDGPLLHGSDLTATLVQSTENAATYTLNISADTLTPGLALLTGATANIPDGTGALTTQITVTFDAPLDRTTLATGLPQPREVIVDSYDALWGELAQTVSGAVRVDAEGVPDGALAFKVDNWRQMLTPGQFPQAEMMLGMLSNMGGDPDNLNLTLTFTEGNMALGPISLGPAPRLLLP